LTSKLIIVASDVSSAYNDWAFAGDDLKDLELVTKGGAQMARKTYKLIKDTPTVKKGAIYQKANDHWSEEYVLLDESFRKSSQRPDAKVAIWDRSLVEDQPEWFVEVFKVTPEYMTREELDQWEAFKAGKAKKSLQAPATKALLEVTAPRTASLSQERLEKFAKVYNSSRTTQSVADKLKITKGSVSAYKSIARKRGIELKKMKRAKVTAQ
jgi:hypothetical protein